MRKLRHREVIKSPARDHNVSSKQGGGIWTQAAWLLNQCGFSGEFYFIKDRKES